MIDIQWNCDFPKNDGYYWVLFPSDKKLKLCKIYDRESVAFIGSDMGLHLFIDEDQVILKKCLWLPIDKPILNKEKLNE